MKMETSAMTANAIWVDGLKSGTMRRGTPTLVQETYDSMREDILSGPPWAGS